MRIFLILMCSIVWYSNGAAQFESDPSKARFITDDIPLFWNAFDEYFEDGGNPFKEYIANGSQGVQDFIPYRIESAKNLRKVVKSNKERYEKVREESYQVLDQTEEIRGYYAKFSELYEEAVFPPTYFVVGALNSGGTSTDNGLIIGMEIAAGVNIPALVSHELIHFNQKYPNFKNTLLQQSIMEGSADFLGIMISGGNINERTYEFAEEREEELCSEFVEIMHETKYYGWLYGSKGKKEGRPNDLGYWMGYKICKAYYDKMDDKRQAIVDILTIEDFDQFLESSGYLDPYLK